MTGSEMILYIINHNLEDEELFKDGKIPGYLTVEEAAVKRGVGIATMKALFDIREVNGIKIGEVLYIEDFK